MELMTKTRRFAAALAFGAALALPAAGAGAQTQTQDGLVNVAVGDVTILQDVDVAVAAEVAANICGVDVGPVAVLGTAVDASGADATVCTTAQGPVTIGQS
jgi:hypothetical protein